MCCFLDRVDYTTYINKGMLADMSDTVPLDALQSNIIDPFMIDWQGPMCRLRGSSSRHPVVTRARWTA